MSQTQQQRVLNYLKENGSINPLVSLMELSVYRLSDTIFKLRENHNIETKMTKTINRFSELVSYATYVYKGEKKINFENINTPWYRKDENFPCLICGKFSKIDNWNDEDYQESKFEWCFFVVESQELLFQIYNHDETENFRLATKEECLSLFREVK